MASFKEKAKRAIPFIAGGAGGHYAYKKMKHSERKHKRRSDRSKKEMKHERRAQEKAIKAYNKDLKKAQGEQKKMNVLARAHGREGLKQLKKYGGEKFMRKSALSPEQNKLLSQLARESRKREIAKAPTLPEISIPGLREEPLYRQGESVLSELLKGGGEAYEKFAAPELSRFRRETVPELAERFTAAGGGGGRSSALANALAEAGTQLGERLGAQRAELQYNAIPTALQYAGAPGQRAMEISNAQQQRAQFGEQARQGRQSILDQLRTHQSQLALGTNPYLNIYRPPTIPGGFSSPGTQIQAPAFAPQSQPYQRPPSFWSQLGQAALPAIGTAAGAAIGGPIGGAIGGGIGGGVSRLFSPGDRGNIPMQPQQQPMAQAPAWNPQAYGGSNLAGSRLYNGRGIG